MKNIELANDLQKEYKPQNFYDLLKLAGNGADLLGYVIDLLDIYTSRKQEELIKNIVERLNKLENRDKIIDCFQSSEMNELMHYALIKSALCHKIEQIKKMADIIIAALEHDKISSSEAEVLINIVSEINTVEAEVFFDIYNNYGKNKVLFEVNFDHTDKLKYESIINRLISKGLLIKEKYKDLEYLNGTTSVQKELYSYTYYGMLFITIIYRN